MKKSRYTEEQISFALKQAETVTAPIQLTTALAEVFPVRRTSHSSRPRLGWRTISDDRWV